MSACRQDDDRDDLDAVDVQEVGAFLNGLLRDLERERYAPVGDLLRERYRGRYRLSGRRPTRRLES